MPAISAVEEQLASTGERKGLGAYYTPPEVVDGLLRLCFDPLVEVAIAAGPEAVASLRVLDPSCGDGNFLVAVADRLIRALTELAVPVDDAARLATRCVVGLDLDERAVEVCRRRLSAIGGSASAAGEPRIWTADSLMTPREPPLTLFAEGDDLAWSTIRAAVDAAEGFDLVIGNPPFLSQLRAETAFSQDYASAMRTRFGEFAGGYVDAAGLFLVLGSQLLKPGGRLCLVEPVSILASRSSGRVRASLMKSAALEQAWFAQEQVFGDAAVEVWAPVFVAGQAYAETSLYVGPSFNEVGAVELRESDGDSWSPLLAAILGVPQPQLTTAGELGDVATGTADFRDQYYGLVGAVVEHSEGDLLPKLITSGLIDPATLLWGERSTRFNKTEFSAPCVDTELLDEAMRSWAKERLVPKVLVATQTKVLEAIVDEEGALLPSVPVLTVESSVVDLWKIAALVGSPPVAAVAARRHLGAALSSDALKLSARDVLALPLPADDEQWTAAARLFMQASRLRGAQQRTCLHDSARAMCAAFAVEDDEALFDWWKQRLTTASPDDEGDDA